MGFDQEELIDSRIRLSAANQGALRVLGRLPIIALRSGGTEPKDELSCSGKSRRVGSFHLRQGLYQKIC